MNAGLGSAQVDRACGVLVASAVGDALGAGYEFGSAPYDGTPAMIGGGLGGFAPGEWTDDTAQALAIARVAATGADLRTADALDAVAAGFAEWFADDPPDVGTQTRQVLRAVSDDPTATAMAGAARRLHERTGRTCGNGSLMRTAPVALAHLDDPVAMVEAAKEVSALTHHDPVAGEACALWCLMIRHAVLTGEFPEPDDVVPLLGETARDWRATLDEAAASRPEQFSANGWAVGALQAAWSAIRRTPVPEGQPCRHLQDALATAIGIGYDTDTVAAIAGALLGARWGVSAVPQEWQGLVHGWPGMNGRDLVDLAVLAVRGGEPDGQGWPGVARLDYDGWGSAGVHPHPLVPGVWIGSVHAVDDLPAAVSAVVSLCRMGTRQVPEGLVRREVRLLDTVEADNPNLDFVVDDAAREVLRLRDAGHGVFLHCVAGQSRTPTVAARVAVLEGADLDEALASVSRVLPAASPQRFLVRALRRLDG